ncbi:low temperature requirement protein A [Streptococcus loxodontisalivarius]|uniref:Low temperature requirement protein LtrA n=1 Tax=Streptococcus loxodontisalivarius TaxID=1349415 RepID=A0ABS2PST7_9STRE|nr:low temperature requirement protein A [Streptococcus loxodontisalivarius]MBM7643108.1 low temperature requirement protein LtrA [Streptococcus loxodontisalivarius]
MSSLIKHKKVELTELFYDLVYVYAISQTTALIHHIHHGIVAASSFFYFFIGLVILINSWMVQTVYTNRFGKNSIRNIVFMFIQMVFLLMSSKAISGDWSENFAHFILPFSGISFTLLIQYIMEYQASQESYKKDMIRPYFYILSIRGLSLAVSAFLPFYLGLTVAALGVVLTWLLPGLFTHSQKRIVQEEETGINFPHLAERLSLLVIITFGEMIIGIADYFSVESLSWASLLIFIIVTNLFMVYIAEIDHMLDENQPGATGNGMIYSHYPIFIGLSFVTVSLSFLGNHEANNYFAFSLFYLGAFLFTAGVLLHKPYNKESHRFPTALIFYQLSSISML